MEHFKRLDFSWGFFLYAGLLGLWAACLFLMCHNFFNVFFAKADPVQKRTGKQKNAPANSWRRAKCFRKFLRILSTMYCWSALLQKQPLPLINSLAQTFPGVALECHKLFYDS